MGIYLVNITTMIIIMGNLLDNNIDTMKDSNTLMVIQITIKITITGEYMSSQDRGILKTLKNHAVMKKFMYEMVNILREGARVMMVI